MTVRIGHTTTALYVAKRLMPRRRWRVTNIEALRGLPLLTYTSVCQMLQNAKWFQPLLGGGSIWMATNSTHARAAAAHAGLGVAVLPRFVARNHAELVNVSDDDANHDVWLITHPEFRRDPKVRAAADFLKRIGGEPGVLC